MKKAQPKASNTFVCCDKKFSFDDIKQHLTEAHGLKEFKGSRKMLMHLDCADEFISQFEWNIGGVTLFQNTCNPRHAEDPMRCK